MRQVGIRLWGVSNFKERKREMRKYPTETENILWQLLKNKQLSGKKFRRQHGVGLYIADFYCDEIKLIIELDGSVHNSKEAKLYDTERNQYFIAADYKILHFSNDQIKNNIDIVIKTISSMFS